jgi:hypothetical protein
MDCRFSVIRLLLLKDLVGWKGLRLDKFLMKNTDFRYKKARFTRALMHYFMHDRIKNIL